MVRRLPLLCLTVFETVAISRKLFDSIPSLEINRVNFYVNCAFVCQRLFYYRFVIFFTGDLHLNILVKENRKRLHETYLFDA